MANADPSSDVISIEIRKVAQISQTVYGSEDDLIYKIALPFFQVIGYGADSFELKFPVQGYRPNRPGRKPEADVVFFSRLPHDLNSSLVVLENKRDDPGFPEQQARFYSTNLFVPVYVAWSGLEFEVWQVQNFRPPSLIGRYRLDRIDGATLSDLKELLAPDKLLHYCTENEIKKFDLDERRKIIEARYLERLASDLRSFKALDLPQIRDLSTHYVELRLRELDAIPAREVQEEIEYGQHPEVIEPVSARGRPVSLPDLLDTMAAIAVIGDPGAGKTTLLRNLCLDNAYADSSLIPIFVSVRESAVTAERLVESALRQIRRYGDTDNPRFLFDAALSKGKILLCVDGIDELGVEEPKDARASVAQFSADLSDILGRHPRNKVVITARRESWPVCRPLLPQSLREFEVLPLSRRAVRIFVSKWFSELPEEDDRVIDGLRARGWPAYATNPLLLTLTCACIPVRGKVPKQESELYDRFLSFILEQWNTTSRVSDRPPLANLDSQVILRLLSEVALGFHLQRRAALTRLGVTDLIAAHISLLGEPVPPTRGVFAELTKQHGMLRSWSIDQHYAFPHLSFQAYFTAKALRARADGHRVIFDHRHDPFWLEALTFYAELGDISDLAKGLLATTDNILQSELLLLAACWAADGQIRDSDLSRTALERLIALARGDNVYLAEQAVNLLARLSIAEAKTALAGMVRDSNGDFTESKVSSFAVSVFGEGVMHEVVAQLVRTGHNHNLLANFAYLPRRRAVESLRALILRTDFPAAWDAGVRHLRRDAEQLMAEIGQDIALAPLVQMISASELTDFEKQGCVSALAGIDDPSVPQILRDIMSGDFPIDCRIEAAGNLAPDEPLARRFLLEIMANESEDYFDRRDAAVRLAEFSGFTDDDLPAFRSLIFDPSPVFWGGPNVAINAVEKIATKASRLLLDEAFVFWQKSSYADAWRVRETVLQVLRLEDQKEKTELRTILKSAGREGWIRWELPKVALEYVRRDPREANDLFVSALSSYNEDRIYGGRLAWAVLRILPQIPLTDGLLEAAIDLAKRSPQDTSAWSAISRVWQRRDISAAQRALFYE
jgi:HEAT repeat protein